VFTTSI